VSLIWIEPYIFQETLGNILRYRPNAKNEIYLPSYPTVSVQTRLVSPPCNEGYSSAAFGHSSSVEPSDSTSGPSQVHRQWEKHHAYSSESNDTRSQSTGYGAWPHKYLVLYVSISYSFYTHKSSSFINHFSLSFVKSAYRDFPKLHYDYAGAESIPRSLL
jgi:hypothetical protein